MSKPVSGTLICPQCGKEQDITVWQSINVSLQKGAKQQILDGNFFTHTCECGNRIPLVYPCLYHDMEKKNMIWLVPEGTGYALGDINKTTFIPSYIYRVVKNSFELIQKIRVFEYGWDDRVLEILKLMIETDYQKRFPEKKIQEVCFNCTGKNPELLILDEDGTVMGSKIQEQSYLNVKTQYLEAIMRKSGRGYLQIDRDWALALLGENQ